MKVTKLIALVVVSLITLVGSAFALPVSVSDVTIQGDNGDYIVLVSLENANVSTSSLDTLTFTVEELGTSVEEIVNVNQETTMVKAYNLRNVVESFSSLKKGETYTLTVETSSGSSMSEAFLFGSERDTGGLEIILEGVKVNGEQVRDVDTLQVLNGETLEVNMRFSALENVEDARLNVFVEGYEHASILESTEIFNLIEGKTYVKTLSIELPTDMDNQQDYKLRIVGANDLSGITYKEYVLYVDTQRHRVDVLDLTMTPSSGVEPGQNIIANVRMKNRGQMEQDSVRVNVAVPALGVSESSYISNLNPEEVATSDDMLLFIPEDAEPKTHNVVVTLSYDDGYTATTEEFTLNVVAPSIVEEESLLISFKNNVNLVAGQENVMKIVVANPNGESKPISLAHIENVWSDVEVSPTLSMVQGGSDAEFIVTVVPRKSVSGERELKFVVKEGAETVKEFAVSTYVEGEEESSTSWLTITLIVLLALALVILLALVVTIARRKSDEDEEEPSSEEEYY